MLARERLSLIKNFMRQLRSPWESPTVRVRAFACNRMCARTILVLVVAALTFACSEDPSIPDQAPTDELFP